MGKGLGSVGNWATMGKGQVEMNQSEFSHTCAWKQC
jgi:hypothetical protein